MVFHPVQYREGELLLRGSSAGSADSCQDRLQRVCHASGRRKPLIFQHQRRSSERVTSSSTMVEVTTW